MRWILRYFLSGLATLVVVAAAIAGWATLTRNWQSILPSHFFEDQVVHLNSNSGKRVTVYSLVGGWNLNFNNGVARVKAGVHEVVVPAAGGALRMDGPNAIIDGAALGTVRLDGRDLGLGDYRALAIHIKGDDSVVSVVTHVLRPR